MGCMSIILMSILAVMTVSGQQNQYGVDVNNDGRIDRAEFHWANPDLDLYEVFGKIDTNNDGFIDQADEGLEGESRLNICKIACNLRHPFVRRNRQACKAKC